MRGTDSTRAPVRSSDLFVLQYGAPIYSCSGSELGLIRARVRARIRSGSSAKLECASSDYHNIRVRGKKTGNGLVV